MNDDGGFLVASRLTVPVCVEDPRGACHWGASSRDKLVCGRSVWILTMMCVSLIAVYRAPTGCCIG
jgi:hypothetical protein